MRRHLYGAVGLYLVLTLLYTVAIPLGESPDEPGHMRCIEQVALDGHLPQFEYPPSARWFQREMVLSQRMCYHMPLYYVVTGYTQRFVAMVSGLPTSFYFPPSNPEFGVESALFLHEDKVAWWLWVEPATILVLRLLSIGLGLVMLWGTYRVARAVYPQQEGVAITAVYLVAGWPQFLFMSRAINNDVLATALAVWVLVLLVAAKRPFDYVLAAAVSCLALLTKASVAFAAGMVLVAWAVAWWRERGKGDEGEKRPFGIALIAMIGLWAGVALLLVGHPILRNHLEVSVAIAGEIRPRVWTLAYWGTVGELTLSSGWVRFGWMNVAAPLSHVYGWWSVIGAAVVLGIGQRWRQVTVAARWWGRWPLLLILIWAGVVLASYIRININLLQPQFRFLLTLLPVLAVLAAAGMETVLGAWWQRGGRLVVPIFLMIYNSWLIWHVINVAYY